MVYIGFRRSLGNEKQLKGTVECSCCLFQRNRGAACLKESCKNTFSAVLAGQLFGDL